MDIKIFVDTADDVRLVRRLTRDIKERGRTPDGVIQQYLETVAGGATVDRRAQVPFV
jgi:uridine kinase